jgi:hypothetical protein
MVPWEVEFRLIGPDDHIIVGRPSSMPDDQHVCVSECRKIRNSVACAWGVHGDVRPMGYVWN